MQYLITCNVQKPALTNWFDAANNFNADVNMVVYDLVNGLYTTDGYSWEEITIDHL